MSTSPKRWPKRASAGGALALACLLWSGVAAALVTLDLEDGATATVRIAIKDPTRIAVAGAPIQEIIGSSVQGEGNPAGTLRVTQDAGQGAAYLMPAETSRAAPTSVFVVTEHATYTLLLVPTDIPGDTVQIRDRRAAVARSADSNAHDRPYNREKSLFQILRAVASDTPTPEMQIEELHTPVVLWQEARFIHERRYTGHPRWTVDVYTLTNVSTASMVLDEREFVTGDVVAVALEQADLAPGQSAVVRVVRPAGVQP